MLTLALLCGCTTTLTPESAVPVAEVTSTPIVTPQITPTPSEEPEEVDEDIDLEQTALECALVGFWHAAPGVPAGYCERYYFLLNHTFIWANSQMDGERQLLENGGTWEIVDGALLLNVEWEWVLVGGEIVPDVLLGSKLEGATSQINEFDPPEVVIYPDFAIHREEMFSEIHPYYIDLGEEQYWKFNAFDDIDSIIGIYS
jgi:hypothetical protein